MATYIYEGPRKNREGMSLNLRDDHEVLMWLMRMCYGEGGKKCSWEKASTMLWSMVNRWFLHPGQKHWPTFQYMVRRFSQPINPRWQRDGDKAIEYAGTKFASESRLRRREKICKLTMEDIPELIYDAVMDFSHGALFLPPQVTEIDKPRISNWASLPSTPRKYPHGIDIDGDWFFEDRELVDGRVFIVDDLDEG